MSILFKSATVLAVALVAAYGIGQFTSRIIATEIEINAPANVVWEELVDTEAYTDWNPFVKKLSGDLTVGNTLAVTVQSEGNSSMNFTPTVLVSDAGHELRWVGRLGFKGVFDGEHSFILEETSKGTTIFRHGETFTGMLAYVLFPLIGTDTKKGFNAMNNALKARVENKAQK